MRWILIRVGSLGLGLGLQGRERQGGPRTQGQSTMRALKPGQGGAGDLLGTSRTAKREGMSAGG